MKESKSVFETVKPYLIICVLFTVTVLLLSAASSAISMLTVNPLKNTAVCVYAVMFLSAVFTGIAASFVLRDSDQSNVIKAVITAVSVFLIMFIPNILGFFGDFEGLFGLLKYGTTGLICFFVILIFGKRKRNSKKYSNYKKRMRRY